MGRKYRLSRDPRLCQESHWRDARVSTAVRISIRPFQLDPRAVIAGIDVGEDFLDIAIVGPQRQHINLARVDLRVIGYAAAQDPFDMDAIAALGSMLADKAPELRGAIALVDSPRWPSDLDWSKAAGGLLKTSSQPDSLSVICPAYGEKLKEGSRSSCRGYCDPSGAPGPDAAGPSPEPNLMVKSPQFSHKAAVAASSSRGREIDRGLRALVSSQRAPCARAILTTLSMFPTPPMRYFGAHLNSANCKPHLRRFGRGLFGQTLNRDYGPATGGIFTRFMIAGFAAYRALESIGADAYECYPDLQFRLWCRHHQLISKKQGRTAALASRMRVLSAVVRRLGFGVSSLRNIRRLDEADAAILALSISAARQYGIIVILENPHEGRFIAALDKPEAVRFQNVMRVTSDGVHTAIPGYAHK